MSGFRRLNFSQQNGLAIFAAVLLAFAFVFGGASRLNLGRLAVVELAALPPLAIALIVLFGQPGALQRYRLALVIAASIALVPAMQLIPLPPQVWTSLPGRDLAIQALNLADLPIGWARLSLAPDATWRSLLALLPPLAIFASMLVGGPRLRSLLLSVFFAGVMATISLCLLQLVSGSDRFSLWAASADGEVVGVFANRNHLATLCLVALPLSLVTPVILSDRSFATRSLWLTLGLLLAVLLIIILGIARSRAGVILAGPALLLSLAALQRSMGRGRSPWIMPAAALTGLAAVAAVAFFAFSPTLNRFETGGFDDGRFDAWPLVLKTASTYLPVGSGIGSFDAVYRSVEPLDQLDPTYFNQAHNEYLETWLEAGWFGAVLLVLFLYWFIRRAWSVWSRRGSESDALARAASVGIVLVLAHSAVDYPLRTETIACIFALLCGLLEISRTASGRSSRRGAASHNDNLPAA